MHEPNKENSNNRGNPQGVGVRRAERVAAARSQVGPFISLRAEIKPETYETMNLAS